MCRNTDTYMKVGQILHSKEAIIFLVELHHLFCDLTLVEEISSRQYGGFSTSRRVTTFNFDQALKTARQIFLHQRIPFSKDSSSWIKNFGRRRPHGLVISFVRYTVPSRLREIRRECSRNRKSIFGQLHSRGNHLFKSHSPVKPQRCHPGVCACWRHRARDPRRHISTEFGKIVVDVGSLWPSTEAANFDRFLLLGIVDNNGGHSTKVGPLR